MESTTDYKHNMALQSIYMVSIVQDSNLLNSTVCFNVKFILHA